MSNGEHSVSVEARLPQDAAPPKWGRWLPLLCAIAFAVPLALGLATAGTPGAISIAAGAVVFVAAAVAGLALFRFSRRARGANEIEHRLLERVSDSEASYRSLVEALPALVYRGRFEAGGSVREVSPRIEALLGFELEDWRRQGRRWFDRVHPDDRETLLEAEEHSRLSGEPLRCDYRMVASDGTEIWVRDEAMVLPEGGRPLLQGVITDVSAQKQAEAVLEERTENLGRTVRSQILDLRESELETVYRLAVAAEFRDDETHEHTLRVGRAAAVLAAAVGLPISEVEMIELAAPLHDIGKLGVSDAILRKPHRLTPQERAMMRRHVEIGKTILEGSGSAVLRMGAEIAHTHHEHWDGTGYPRGLAEEEIPICGRITAIADAFDVMSHRRPYKQAWPIDQTLAELRLSSGTQFDPGLIEAFEDLDLEKLVAPIERAASFDDGSWLHRALGQVEKPTHPQSL